MRKELAESLRHMQNNPTTGTPHNHQMISTQVETIFAIDQLTGEMKKLVRTIETSERQNQKLEKSNINLQRTMLVLTFITTIVATFPILRFVFDYLVSTLPSLIPHFTFNMEFLTTLASIIAGILSVLISFLTSKYQKKFVDVIRMSDNINIVVRDKQGRIKDIRSQ